MRLLRHARAAQSMSHREVHIGARLVCCGGVAAQHMHNKVAFIYDTTQTWQISFDRGLRFIYRNECNIYNNII